MKSTIPLRREIVRLRVPGKRFGGKQSLWVLLLGLLLWSSARPLVASSMDRQLESVLKAEAPAFLSAASPQAKAAVAARVVVAIVQQPDAGRIAHDLAEWTGALIGASGKDAPAIAGAIRRAAGTNHADIVRSAVSLASPIANASDDIRKATVAAAGAEEKPLPPGAAAPLTPETQRAVEHAARGFLLLRNNWDPARSEPLRDSFADRDGGEPPSPREQRREISDEGSEGK